ncbi:hypothetical protein CI610_03430 [invertebrate metagenome]|uniref:VOC domain-containing protein n=1 Tax=invertebrate metagenome TaxID=1711999 RepID=A0A2H9T339_9ZZZZ
MDTSVKYSGYIHIALEIDDTGLILHQLRALGITITETVEYKGAQFFFIRDPDGNVIEFHQPANS